MLAHALYAMSRRANHAMAWRRAGLTHCLSSISASTHERILVEAAQARAVNVRRRTP